MIERYTSEEMAAVWSEPNKYAVWGRVELEVMKAQGVRGIVPKDLWRALDATVLPTAQQVYQAEKVLKHDLMAFLEAWRQNTNNRELHRWLHYGLTSSDVVETGQAILLGQANWLVLNDGYNLLTTLIDHALEHRHTIRIGRTHGQAAEPTTWGYRVADFAFAINRGLERLIAATEGVQTAHVSGPLGNYAHTPRAVELDVAKALDLSAPESATQVLMRDSLGAWAYAMANLVTICDAVALEIRHGQRTEVKELFEGVTSGQQGSSSMPHKANPITAEKISGLARLARSYVMPLTEGIALWHERDISHSSVERVALPDLCAITQHVIICTTDLVRNLRVNVAQMRYNVATHGTATIMNRFIREGMTRMEAYEEAKKGQRDQCAKSDIEHVWDQLELLKHALDEARTMAGVSQL